MTDDFDKKMIEAITEDGRINIEAAEAWIRENQPMTSGEGLQVVLQMAFLAGISHARNEELDYARISEKIEHQEYEYRVKEVPGGLEAQMLYTTGMTKRAVWFSLLANGYWSDPDAYSTGEVKIRHIFDSREDADRAIVCARRINGEPLIGPVE